MEKNIIFYSCNLLTMKFFLTSPNECYPTFQLVVRIYPMLISSLPLVHSCCSPMDPIHVSSFSPLDYKNISALRPSFFQLCFSQNSFLIIHFMEFENFINFSIIHFFQLLANPTKNLIFRNLIWSLKSISILINFIFLACVCYLNLILQPPG